MTKNFAQKHGSTNHIIKEQEKYLLATVDRALASSSNSQIIGNNGELPLKNFLSEHLPYTFKVATGHFIAPSGKLSPQVDIMVLDARYPFLNVNLDGSVLAMLHSVVATIEVKTNITSKDIKKVCSDSEKLHRLYDEIYDSDNDWNRAFTKCFAYRSKIKLKTLESVFYENVDPFNSYFDLHLMRLHASDQKLSEEIGVELHFEPEIEEENNSVNAYYLCTIHKKTPLSDLYYNLVQNCYYTLGSRKISDIDIGRHVMSYMAWSTISPNDINSTG